MEVDADHFVGTLWTGPVAGPQPGTDAAPWWLHLRIGYLSAPPPGESQPLSSRLDQVFVERAGRPLATRSELALGVLATGAIPASAERSPERLVDRIDPLWCGTTTVWRAEPALDAVDPPEVRWRFAQIEVTRPNDAGAQPELALVFEGEVIPRGEDEESGDHPIEPGPPVVQREHVVLPPAAFEEGESRRFFLPAPRRAVPHGGFAVEIVRIPAPAETTDALERGRAAIERSLAAARADTSAITPDESFRFESGTALPALEQPKLRRSALVFLAQVARAPLAGDLALDTEPAALESFAASLAPLVRGDKAGGTRGEKQGEGRELPALGWALERAAFTWLTTAAQDEKHPLPKELSALLVAHAGELGRFPELCRSAVLECDGLAAFRDRLVQENRIFLEDADPSARLRAFEWLRDRGAAPEGFDPLGPLAERRAALERARDDAAKTGEGR